MTLALWQHGAALALVAADIVARAGRSVALLPVGWTKAMIVNCCGDALAAITPARIGGDPIRFVWFTRSGLAGPAVLASFATETVINAVVLGAGAVLLLVCFAGVVWPMTRDAARRAVTGAHLTITAAALALCALIFVALIQRFPGLPARLGVFLRESWGTFRTQPRSAVAWASTYTVASMLARMAILPVLLARTPGIGTGALIVGSVAALYALLLVPTPGGIGPIEAGFFAGFGEAMDGREIAALLITWRAYAWLCGAGIGALLLLWERRHTP